MPPIHYHLRRHLLISTARVASVAGAAAFTAGVRGASTYGAVALTRDDAGAGKKISASVGANSVRPPHALAIEDWENEGTPVKVGTIFLDEETRPLIFEDTELAAELGEVRIIQSSKTLVLKEFEIGVTMFIVRSALNAEAVEPVYQILIGFKPHGRWQQYPAIASYDRSLDSTILPPFKIKLFDAGDGLLHTFELHDGLPINSRQRSGMTRLPDLPLRPDFNCAMMLAWQSARLKISTNAYKYFPGVTKESLRPSQARRPYSSNEAMPLLAGRSQINSLGNYFQLPRWPIGSGDTYTNDALDPNRNPFDYPTKRYYTSAAGTPGAYASRAIGWDYEPASISGHNWYTGPGGPRFDRAAIPTAIAQYLSDPTGVRQRDGSTLRENCEAFVNAYFNHSHHYFQDVRRMTGLPDHELLNGGWSHGASTYYGVRTDYVPGGTSRHVNLFTIPNGSTAPPAESPEFTKHGLPKDRDGRAVWSGWAVDMLHAYCAPGWATLLFNSPMHLLCAKHRFAASFMSQLGGSLPQRSPGFLHRQGAWRWLQWITMWKMGTSHDFGFRKNQIEDRMQIDLEAIYVDYVQPATDPEHAAYRSNNSRCLRAFGQLCSATAWVDSNSPLSDRTWSYYVDSGALGYYMATVFVLMKQTGMWAVMVGKSARCKATLEFMITCYDRASIDFILDTDGRLEGYARVAPLVPITSPPSTNFANNWLDLATNYFPRSGQEDWIHDSVGKLIAERDVCQHLRAQWAFMRPDYFPEYPNPRLKDAVRCYERFYEARATVVAHQPTPNAMIEKDWSYRIPPLGRLRSPV